jgi:alkylation response protein AidB-like acyl-CoA dehydrogenase
MNGGVYSSSMDFRPTDEQLTFQRHCHAFARDVMRPAPARYDREQAVPYDVIREARARGLHGMP